MLHNDNMPYDLTRDPHPILHLHLLGRMQAHDAGGVSVLPRGRKARAMLAALAMAGGTPMLRDTLIQLLWSQRDQEQARASFRQTLHELQTALAPATDVLSTGRGVVTLRTRGVWCDAQAIVQGTPNALELLHGRLGEDLVGLDPAFDRWLGQQRDRLGRAALQLAEAALDSQSAAAGIVVAAERLLLLQPTHETACRALMRAHHALGRTPEALAAYDRCAAALSDQAGLQPSTETRALRDLLLPPIGPPGQPLAQPDPDRPTPGRGSGVRLGVMPFRSLDNDDGLSIGLAEEITTALARFRWMFLIGEF